MISVGLLVFPDGFIVSSTYYLKTIAKNLNNALIFIISLVYIAKNYKNALLSIISHGVLDIYQISLKCFSRQTRNDLFTRFMLAFLISQIIFLISAGFLVFSDGIVVFFNIFGVLDFSHVV